MKRHTLLTLLAVALLVAPAMGEPTPAGGADVDVQSYSLTWSVVGGGGGNAGAQIAGTAGQTVIGWSSGAAQLGAGFWYGVTAGSKHSVYLPVTLKQ